MPISKYLRLTIGDKQIQVTNPEELPISIDYNLEDPDNFQDKPSSEILELKIPATLMNDRAGNTFHNPDIMDLTDGQVFNSNQSFTLDENGHEIMNGKAFLNSVTHNAHPVEYEYDLLGDNANWKVDLEESTLYDFLHHINFIFTKEAIVTSWDFDGTDPALPFVFAPIRYRSTMGGTKIIDNAVVPDDENMEPTYLKPSLSKYWILFWAFKSVGYRITSGFFDLAYFRRQVMPWTWGSFLSSERSKFNVHRFRAKQGTPNSINLNNTTTDIWWPCNTTNDSTDGMFDNNTTSSNPDGDYTYIAATEEMSWTYNPPDFLALDAMFSLILDVDAGAGSNSNLSVNVHWYIDGIQQKDDQVVHISAPYVTVSPETIVGQRTSFFLAAGVTIGQRVSARVFVHAFGSKLGNCYLAMNVAQFQIDYFRIPLGGRIDFENYDGFKKYKFLDFFRGVIDEFNLSVNTDPINKIVYIEPTHAYSVTDNPSQLQPGYFLDDFIEWNKKRDLSKEWKMTKFRDYDQELTFAYKDDSNDGILKIVQDRNINRLAAGKYVFPDRFKTGKKEIENRFFSATMHFEASQWKEITGIAPQLVCLIPENISNTSNSEAENTFVPKSCYYKGNIDGVGGWRFDGEDLTSLPFLFSVNYKDGGQNDPILSYSDEKIANAAGFVIGKGLLKRFYWQRLAIMRNGQFYDAWFRLKNIDIANQLHREHIAFDGHRWELVQIKGYKPLQDQSTNCFLRRWSPITVDDFEQTFPSADNILNNNSVNPLDIKYAQLKGLISDIPR
jgi:hypothetical protein